MENIMKKIISMLLVVMAIGASAQVYAGSCDHSTDRAKDGSVCGDRSADARKGGGGSR